VKRGEIWWSELEAASGSEAGYRRPVLIVQSDFFTRSRIQTVIVVPLTGNLSRAKAPGNVLLPECVTGLPRDSVANVSQVAAIDKELLIERVSELPVALVESVDDGLRLILDLGPS